MSNVSVHSGGGVGPLKLFSGATATSEASAAVYDLDAPVRHFSLQVASGSTSTVVSLQGGLSSASTGLITLVTWSSDTNGTVLSTESTGPLSRITASFDGGASSGGMSAWFSASP